MNKRALAGVLAVALGVALMGAGLWVWRAQEQQDTRAGSTAGRLLEDFMTVADPENAAMPDFSEKDGMTAVTLNGYEVVGVLTVPKLGLELPILADWNYDLLKIAPCRYSGSAEGRDLILLGHNYKSHFRPLGQLEPGDAVIFTAADGTEYRYAVTAVETIHRSETERLPSDHHLSIFTCTLGGVDRIVVRCDLAEE